MIELTEYEKKIEILKKYDIVITKYNSLYTEISYFKNALLYDTQNFITLNNDKVVDYIISAFKNIGVIIPKNTTSTVEDTIDDSVKDRLEYLTNTFLKLGITKQWIGCSFYLFKNNRKLKYNFNDYISYNKEVLVADIVNKFKNLELSLKTSGTDSMINDIHYITCKMNYDDISKKKENIRNILKSKSII